MRRYSNWMRRLGIEGAEPHHIEQARKLLGFVAQRAEALGLHQYRLRRKLADGTVITATLIGGIPSIEIQTVEIPQIEEVRVNNRLWIPRGFVVYPSTADVFDGWGMPVVPAAGETLWDTLDPGLDVARWTEGGRLGEVLLTKDFDAGYPPKTSPTMPLFYDPQDATKAVRGKYKAPRTGAWAAHRPEFLGYPAAPAFAREFLEYTNSQRGTPLTPPFRGYFEDATFLAEKVPALLFDGADPTLPDTVSIGYREPESRQNKDGALEIDSADAVISYPPSASDAANAIDGSIGIFDPAFFEDTQLDVGLQGPVATAELQHRMQWIRYGNQVWRSTNPDLPILSWDGDDGMLLPFSLYSTAFSFTGGHWQPLAGTLVGPWPDYEISDLDTLTVPLRAQPEKPLYSKNLYAFGRTLGVLPGFVMSAAIQVREAADRIIVLTWHQEDQDVAPAHGFEPPEAHVFRKLRAYFCDVAPRNGLRCVPSRMLTGSDWVFAGYAEMTHYSEEFLFPTQFPRQVPRFSKDGTKFATIWGMMDASYNDIFVHTIVEYSISALEAGVFSYAVDETFPDGDGGFNQESYEAVDYDDSDTRRALKSRLLAWPYADWYPEYGDATVDIRVLMRDDGSGTQPYQSEVGSPLDPQCRAAFAGSWTILDVVDYVTVGTYNTGNCVSLANWTMRLIVVKDGERIHDATYPCDATNRVWGYSGGRWHGQQYVKNKDGDWIVSVEMGAFKNQVYIRKNDLSFGLAPSNSRVAGFVESSIPNIQTLVNVSDSTLSLVPVGVV